MSSLPRVPARLALVAIAIASIAPVGCKEEKSAVEKRADEMAKSAASSSASASASAAPDPEEARYAKIMKASLARIRGYMTIYQDIEKSAGGKADLDKLRGYFAKGPDGDKAYEKASADATFAGKQGVPILEFEVQSNDCNLKQGTCVAPVWEKQSQRGKFACYSFKLTFSIDGDELFWKEKSIPVLVPCDAR